MFHVPEYLRDVSGPFKSTAGYGNNGLFLVPVPQPNSHLILKVVASDGLGWEHVSVSLKSRCPTWVEMCHVKALFWDADDSVIQFHPPKKVYINCHDYCLHLWRPIGRTIELPPSILVGI